MKKLQVIFQSSGRRREISEGKTIIEGSRELGFEIESTRGGEKNCGKCKTRLGKGILRKIWNQVSPQISLPHLMRGKKNLKTSII